MKELTTRSIFWAVLSALCAFAAVAAVGYGLVTSYIAERTVKEKEVAIARTEAVSESFRASASNAGNVINEEYKAAESGNSGFKIARDKAKESMDGLTASAATHHEMMVAIYLERVRSGFTECINSVFDRTISYGSVAQCEQRYPATCIAEALAK